MNNFIFQNPTRLIFGKGMIAELAKAIPANKRIMVTFGGGSVKKTAYMNRYKKPFKAGNILNSGA